MKQITLISPFYQYLRSVNCNIFTNKTEAFRAYLKNEFDPSSPTLYLGDERDSYTTIDVNDMETYKAGIAHIKHICDITPEYPWPEQNQSGGKHKRFYYHEDHILLLGLYHSPNDTFPVQGFVLVSTTLPDNMDYFQYKDEELLFKFKSFYRKQRLAKIIQHL